MDDTKQKILTRSLIISITNHDIERVRVIITQGADVNRRDSRCNMPPLVNAVIMGYTDIVECLINAGADLNIVDSYGYTSLIIAVKNRDDNMTKFLVNLGADVNYQGPYGETALMKASQTGKIDIVSLLVKAGADINAVNQSGETAFTYSMQFLKTDIMKLLVELGIDLSIKDNEGRCPLEIFRQMVDENSGLYNLADEITSIYLCKQRLKDNDLKKTVETGFVFDI